MSELLGFLSGGQRDEYDFHYVNFDIYIRKTSLKDGLKILKDTMLSEFLEDKDDYSKCYIPHMDFEKGELMSLNIVCKKENVDIK